MNSFDTLFQAERRNIITRSLPILGKAFCAFYLLLVFLHPLFLATDMRWVMSGLAVVSFLIYLISLVDLRNHTDMSDTKLKFYQILYLSIGAVNTFAHIVLFKDIQQTTNVIFVFFVMTSIGLSYIQFFTLLVMIDIIWLVLIWIFHITGTDFILHYTLALFFGSVISPVLFLARIRLLKTTVFETMQRQLTEQQLKNSNDKLKKLALFDSLTGIPNRRHLEEFFFASCARAKIDKMPVTLMMCDVDHFKLFNETHGHQTGDKALVLVATALQKCIRSTRDIAARFGGEEFVLIFPGMNYDIAGGAAQRVCNTVMDHSLENNTVTVSVGVYTFIPSDSTSLDSVFQKADKALYKAKEGGRNCFRQISTDDLEE